MPRLICFRVFPFTRFHSTRKKRGEEDDPFGLTAALDQMSFAQDIVMIESDPTKSTTVVEMKPAVVQPEVTGSLQPESLTASEAVTSEPAGVTQAQQPSDKVQVKTTTATPPSTSASRAPTATTTPAKGIPEKTFTDPLRDLILLSEAILIDDEEEFLRSVKSLAEDSSCLDYVLEVKSTDSYNQLQQRKQDLVKSSTLEQGISLFQNPKEMVDPVKEAEFLKTLEALEDTDVSASAANLSSRAQLITLLLLLSRSVFLHVDRTATPSRSQCWERFHS